MKVICVVLGATLFLSGPFALGQTQAPNSSNGESAPLVFWNRQITVFRSNLNQLSPADRAARARERLASLPDDAAERIVTTEATFGQYKGIIVSVNDQTIFTILTGDLDYDSSETLQAAVDRATAQMRAALEARAQQGSLSSLIRGTILSVVATLALIFGLWLITRAALLVKARLQRTADVRAKRMGLAAFDIQSVLHSISRTLAMLTAWSAAGLLVYLWLTFVLLRFPYTLPWGQELGAFLISILATLGSGMVTSIPGMFTVVVIFLVTRLMTRLVIAVFREVEKGDLALPGLHADTARATRYLVVALVWIFAMTVAYPYIPGSNTDAFKGVSVLVGLMVSLGSAGLVNQVMSGLVVVYSRALKPGEFVQVGDDLGIVTDVGMLSTKIITRKKEEITIPNAVLVGTKTVNYSRHAAEGEASVSTTVTIGYDAPWREVHELLLQAASKTNGVKKDPAPLVLQRALANFHVEYELVVGMDQPETRLVVLSELHMNIQDAFNEAGIQIMSPAFESQPEQRVLVPKSKWFPNQAVAVGKK